MPIYKNVNSTWTIVKHIWKNVNGVWTKVRRAFRNQGGTWVQYHGDNDFTAYSLGLLQNQTAGSNGGLWVNGTQVAGPVRSYTLLQFDKYGNVTFNRGYDIYGEGQNGTPSATPYGSAQFSADVSAMAAGQLFLVVTYDEPQTGTPARLPIAAFDNAMTVLGATSAVFGSSSFANRGAYMLLGVKGSAATFEAYRGTESTIGSDTGTLDGAIELTFNIVNGAYANITRIM